MATNAKPIFLWNNLVRTATLSASTEASGFPIENVADWRTFLQHQGTGALEQWLKADFGAPVAFDSLALAGHDLHTQGATISLAGSNNDADWTPIVAPFAPASDLALYRGFGSVTYQYAKLTTAAGYTAPPSIGVWFVGPKMQMPVWTRGPFNPNPLKKVTTSQRSQNGQFLATIEKYAWREIALKFGRIPSAFFNSDILLFERDHVPLPFFWVWDETNHPDDVYLMRKTDGDIFDAPLRPALREWNIKIEGVAE